MRGRDWVLPAALGPALSRRADGPAVRAALVAASAPGTGLPVAATAGGVSGRARAAAHVTPIEEARNPRIPLMLNIVIQTCPSRT
ncbi:hypothetical protein GCM10010378_13450 [Streptomyces viridochromogenes]